MAKNLKSIYSALLSNVLIAVTKFVAGAYTGSSSMIAEGIHSIVDTINELLLLYGLKRSRKPADRLRPFGYGKELYFWSFIVSILIFGLGGGLSIYQGIMHIIEPGVLTNPGWNYAVLLMSFLFEGTSLVIAIKEFNKQRGGLGFWAAVVKSKDPTSFVILFEDGAAVLGLLIVFVLMTISHATGLAWIDGLASVLVGCLLIGAAFIIARESRSLLLGEGITPETQEKIKNLAEKDEAVVKVVNILSTYESPEEIVLMLLVIFEIDLETADITSAIERVRKSIKEEFMLVEFVIIQPQVNQ